MITWCLSKGQVWKQVLKLTFFGLKYNHNLENRAAHPNQEFPGVPHWKDYQKASNVGYWTAEELKTSNLVWQAWHDLPCRTKFLRVLPVFAIFPAIRKNTFSQINITANIFPTKICSRVNILLLKFATQKHSTITCLFRSETKRYTMNYWFYVGYARRTIF